MKVKIGNYTLIKHSEERYTTIDGIWELRKAELGNKYMVFKVKPATKTKPRVTVWVKTLKDFDSGLEFLSYLDILKVQ